MSDKKIIALAGAAGVGKSTVANIMSVRPVAFAQPLNDMLASCLRDLRILDPDDPAKYVSPNTALFGPSEYRESVVMELGVTVRHMLQTLRTDWGRDMIHPEIWVRTGMNRAMSVTENGRHCVITDTQFLNEFRAVKEAGGEVWLIRRPGREPLDHASEQDLKTAEFAEMVDVTIENAGSLDRLATLVSAVCRSRLGQ